MKKLGVSGLILLALVSLKAQVEFIQVQTSEEMDKVWSDALKLNKPVFVDIYATWCGPCKWLDANVFAMKEAGEYMNSEFINVKMDGESEFGRLFAMKSGLTAYPSLFIFNPEQKLMNMIVGAKPWEELQPAMISTVEYFPVLEVLQNKYESGLLKKEEYPAFIAALRKMGKEQYGNSVAAGYLDEFVKDNKRSLEDIQVLAFYTDQSSGNWTKLTSDIPLLQEALGLELEIFIDHALTRAIETAVESSDISYIQQINSILPAMSEGTSLDTVEMETRSYIYFYHYSDRIDEMISYIDNQYLNKRSGDHEWLFVSASNAVFLDPQNRLVAEKGLEWFQKCIDILPNQEYYYHLALCEYFTDSPEKSVSSLKKSLEFTENPEIIENTLSIIKQVEGEIEQ